MAKLPKIIKASDGTFEVKGLEVFRAGDYGEKGTFSAADIAAMAANYDASTHEAPLTVDHTEHGPAYGWVQTVRAEGDTLVADIVRIPEDFAETMKRGAWRKRSAEIYTELEGVGGPYLKAVTLLGAAAPHVKGMTDWQFKHATAKAISAEFAESQSPCAATLFSRPAGAQCSVIRFSGRSETVLGHSHEFVVDEANNGWAAFDEDGGHQHVIVAGQVQPAKDANGVEHTHPPLNLPTAAKFTTPSEGKKMDPNVKSTDDAAKMARDTTKKMAEDPAATIEALKAELAAVRAELAEAKAKVGESEDMADQAKFSEVFTLAVAEKKATPGEKDALFAIFKSIPRDAKAVKFADGEKTPRETFLDTIAKRAPNVNLTDPITPKQFTGGDAGKASKFSDDPEAASREAAKKVDEHIKAEAAKGRKLNFVDAARELQIPIK